ncbi:MAG: thioredoxin family protein [Syntrophomonadaceae bacterium]|nr:thioredoxin family protein [Syntrophomonadaceae bacterium]
MEIKVLGPGCSRCESLEKEVRNALAELDVAADLKKVKDIQQMMAYKILATPALVINDKVKVTGRVPKREEIKKYIQEEL